jgi:hypothetical protein
MDEGRDMREIFYPSRERSGWQDFETGGLSVIQPLFQRGFDFADEEEGAGPPATLGVAMRAGAVELDAGREGWPRRLREGGTWRRGELFSSPNEAGSVIRRVPTHPSDEGEDVLEAEPVA